MRSGALDNLGPKINRDYDRAVMFAAMTEAVHASEQSAANASAGMTDLFGDVIPSGSNCDDVYADFRGVRVWSMRDRLGHEKDTLGLYLTGHPIDQYRSELKHLVSSRIIDLKPERRVSQKIAGLVVALRVMKTKKGDTMAFVTLDDRSGRIEVAVFADTYNEYREKLVKDELLVITGEVNEDNYTEAGGLKVRAESVMSLDDARMQSARSIGIHIDSSVINNKTSVQLGKVLMPYQEGNCVVKIDYQNGYGKARYTLGSEWRVEPRDELIEQLREMFGTDKVQLQY